MVSTSIQEFLCAVFFPNDTIALRWIETWIEMGKTKSLVQWHGWPTREQLLTNFEAYSENVEIQRANQFFGVCPRAGIKDFDHAWQVRTVRTLWADVDECRPDDALHRCDAAGVPRPSILLDSGHGAHLYWLLGEPFLIDDAGPGLAKVEGKQQLSPKAARLQGFVRELVAALGGDAKTHDLARLLRLPDTLNRKDLRNGRPPVLCEIVEMDADRRYGIEELASTAKVASTGMANDTALSAEAAPLRGAAAGSSDSDGKNHAVKWLEDFIERHQIQIKTMKDGGDRWVCRWLLATCPFCNESDGSAVLTLSSSRKYGFTCQHSRCNGKKGDKKTWADFRRHFEGDGSKPAAGRQTVVARLVEIAVQQCELLLDADNEQPLARVPGHGWLPIDTKAFKLWLARESGLTVNSSQLSDAVLNVSARCGTRTKTFRRVARTEDAIYIDLLQDGKAVKITEAGWTVEENPPVVFLGKKDMAPLPEPLPGGSIEELKRFINAGGDFEMVLAFLLDALKGRKPYMLLLVNGEEGSAKSTFTTFLGELIDPCQIAKTKSLPKDLRTLAIMAGNRHLLAFDNVSKITDEMSDALCRVATGAGLVERSLYTNGDEEIFGGANPIILNGIPELGHRSDFLGRACKVTLPPIPDDCRRPEKELLVDFMGRRPYILGALYDLLASGLKNRDATRPDKSPRMADTYQWLLACERGSPYRLGERFYRNVQDNVKGVALDTLLGKTVVGFMKDQLTDGFVWSGTMSKLHAQMKDYWAKACGHDPEHGQYNYAEFNHYPGNARWLSGRLNEISSSLRLNGILIDRHEEGHNQEKVVVIDARRFFGFSSEVGSEPEPGNSASPPSSAEAPNQSDPRPVEPGMVA